MKAHNNRADASYSKLHLEIEKTLTLKLWLPEGFNKIPDQAGYAQQYTCVLSAFFKTCVFRHRTQIMFLSMCGLKMNRQ